MKRALAVCYALFLFCSFSLAQSALSPDAPSREDVMKFLEASHARRNLDMVLTRAMSDLQRDAVANFKKKVPDASPEMLKDVDQTLSVMTGALDTDELLDRVIPVYQRNFTRSDLAAITEFYSSPVGVRLLEKQPTVIRESMDAGRAYAQQKMAAVSIQMNSRIQELAKKYATTKK
jgi:uncharacterized protein